MKHQRLYNFFLRIIDQWEVKTKKLVNIVIDKNGDNYINKPIIEIQNPDLDGYERIDDYLNIIIDDNNSIAHINCKELINKMSDQTYNTQPKINVIRDSKRF